MNDALRAGGFTAVEDGARWTCAGAITLENAGPVLDAARALPLPRRGIVDLSGLVHADSAALAVLLALRRRAFGEGGDLSFSSAPPLLASLARVYGVDALIGV